MALPLEEYSKEFLEEIRADAAINESDPEYEFISKALDILVEQNEFQDPIQFYFGKPGKRNRAMQINGYCFDETDRSLILIISDFEDKIETSTLINTQIDADYKKMLFFLDEVCNGNLEEYCDDADDTLKLARLIKSRMNANESSVDLILKVKFFIITNKILSNRVKKLKQENFNGKPVELNLWHLERFYEATAGDEPIYINIPRDFGFEGIPCIKGNIGENLGYEAYTAIIPGKLLASIYIEYGSKVLEGNVRAFLGTAGSKSVNSGIKRTIALDPTKFFTYNNGIATTAANIEYVENNGQLLITAMEDLQIINGGQTTATLAEAVLKKTNVDLEGIYVPMKLTVISDRDTVDEDGIRFYDSMVEKIARYANSQNKVTAADFFSNSPFHILMEKMSKRYLAPPVNGNPNPTGWYYERSKKKYNQEQIKMTKAEQGRFALKFPKKQIIKKEDLSKYLYTIECKPDIVSRGRNWVMKDFGASINETYKKNKEIFNEFYFKKCIAAAIIFKSVDNYLEQLKKIPGAWYKVGGYKLNIVPYSIAKLIHSIPKGYTLDWMKIWQKQTVSAAFMDEIEKITKMTNDFICDSHGIIVTEYCKKKDTWDEFKNIPYKLSEVFLDELLTETENYEQESNAKKEQKELNNISVEIEVVKMGAEYWQHLLDEGMKKSALNGKEISLLRVGADMNKTGKLPSSAQAKLMMEIRKKLDIEGIV